jgi:hypothetical protein
MGFLDVLVCAFISVEHASGSYVLVVLLAQRFSVTLRRHSINLQNVPDLVSKTNQLYQYMRSWFKIKIPRESDCQNLGTALVVTQYHLPVKAFFQAGSPNTSKNRC